MEFINYLTIKTAIGRVGIAESPIGICAIYFDDNGGFLEYLQKTFSNSSFNKISQVKSKWARDVISVIDNPKLKIKIPLDIRGTDFQKSVWLELLKITCGKRVSYKYIAEKIGNVQAVRAVANACGANKIPIIIPCHRVIASDGSLGGYSGNGGIKTKQKLLEREVS